MGYYIESTSKGISLPPNFKGKCKALIDDGALQVDSPAFQDNLVCVVDNGFFAAAGFIYSEQELYAFTDPSDRRRRAFFIYEHAAKLSGYEK